MKFPQWWERANDKLIWHGWSVGLILIGRGWTIGLTILLCVVFLMGAK